MARPKIQWRDRMTTAMTVARTIDRQTDSLRAALGELAGGTGDAERVRRILAAVRWQLDHAERIADSLTRESPTGDRDAG